MFNPYSLALSIKFVIIFISVDPAVNCFTFFEESWNYRRLPLNSLNEVKSFLILFGFFFSFYILTKAYSNTLTASFFNLALACNIFKTLKLFYSPGENSS